MQKWYFILLLLVVPVVSATDPPRLEGDALVIPYTTDGRELTQFKYFEVRPGYWLYSWEQDPEITVRFRVVDNALALMVEPNPLVAARPSYNVELCRGVRDAFLTRDLSNFEGSPVNCRGDKSVHFSIVPNTWQLIRFRSEPSTFEFYIGEGAGGGGGFCFIISGTTAQMEQQFPDGTSHVLDEPFTYQFRGHNSTGAGWVGCYERGEDDSSGSYAPIPSSDTDIDCSGATCSEKETLADVWYTRTLMCEGAGTYNVKSTHESVLVPDSAPQAITCTDVCNADGGDWNVTTLINCRGRTIPVDHLEISAGGDLRLYNVELIVNDELTVHGNLTLNASTLVFNGSSDGASGLNSTGAVLLDNNSIVKNGDTSSAEYYFYAQEGSHLTLNTVTVSEAGWTDPYDGNKNPQVGVLVATNTAFIRHSTFYDNYYDLTVFDANNTVIYNNSFGKGSAGDYPIIFYGDNERVNFTENTVSGSVDSLLWLENVAKSDFIDNELHTLQLNSWAVYSNTGLANSQNKWIRNNITANFRGLTFANDNDNQLVQDCNMTAMAVSGTALYSFRADNVNVTRSFFNATGASGVGVYNLAGALFNITHSRFNTVNYDVHGRGAGKITRVYNSTVNASKTFASFGGQVSGFDILDIRSFNEWGGKNVNNFSVWRNNTDGEHDHLKGYGDQTNNTGEFNFQPEWFTRTVGGLTEEARLYKLEVYNTTDADRYAYGYQQESGQFTGNLTGAYSFYDQLYKPPVQLLAKAPLATVTGKSTYEIPLYFKNGSTGTGVFNWNLVGIPLDLENKSIEHVFGGVPNITAVEHHNDSGNLPIRYDFYNVSESDLFEINASHGYFVHANFSEVEPYYYGLQIEGRLKERTFYVIKPFWNLISYGSLLTCYNADKYTCGETLIDGVRQTNKTSESMQIMYRGNGTYSQYWELWTPLIPQHLNKWPQQYAFDGFWMFSSFETRWVMESDNGTYYVSEVTNESHNVGGYQANFTIKTHHDTQSCHYNFTDKLIEDHVTRLAQVDAYTYTGSVNDTGLLACNTDIAVYVRCARNTTQGVEGYQWNVNDTWGYPVVLCEFPPVVEEKPRTLYKKTKLREYTPEELSPWWLSAAFLPLLLGGLWRL